MMEWTMPETAGFGVVMLSVVFLLNKFLGQRADPKLFDVLNLAMEGFAEIKDDIKEGTKKTNKAFSLLAENINKGNEASMALVRRVELSERNAMTLYNKVIEAFVTFQEAVKSEHQLALKETQAIVPTLEPVISALTAQQAATEKSNRGMQTIMEGLTKTQHVTNSEILAALQRIEASLEEFKADNSKKIEKIEADVNAVKADIAKKATQETPVIDPAPANQPIIPVMSPENRPDVAAFAASTLDGAAVPTIITKPKPKKEEDKQNEESS